MKCDLYVYIYRSEEEFERKKKNERIAAATKDKRIGGLEGLQRSSQHHRLKWARFGIPNPFSGTSFVVVVVVLPVVVAYFFSFYESFRSSRLWVARHQLLFCYIIHRFLTRKEITNEHLARTTGTGKIQGDCGCSSSSYGLESLQVVKRT